ncbi:MAG TPA: hypothetical protein VFW88_09530 [Burkholderiales bacterium]|nr:hypothetical protein [Burkholderiales bacterium]
MNEQLATCQTNTDMAESDNGISCRQSGGRQQEAAVGSGSALKSVAGTGISFELQEKLVKRSVYTAGTVVTCRSNNSSSAAREPSTMRAYYIFLARRGTSGHTDRNARWFGPFATTAQARMIRTSAFSLGLAVDEAEVARSAEQHAGNMKEAPWRQLANA